jgi:hypothetical protein
MRVFGSGFVAAAFAAVIAVASADATASASPRELASDSVREHDPHDDAYYVHTSELAEVLARSPNPRHLMVAAKLRHGAVAEALARRVSPEAIARVAAQSTLPDADALVREALRLGANDPLLWWIAATDCPATPATCDAPAAIARLRELAPSNGAVWLLVPRGTTPYAGTEATGDADGDAVLDRIATASRHDYYIGERTRAYLDAFDQLPLQAEAIVDPAEFSEPVSPEVVRGLLAFGLALADALPGPQAFTSLCGEDTLARLGEPRAARCREAMRTMLRTADSPMPYRIAGNALLRLLPPGAERDTVQRDQQRMLWQITALGVLQSAGEDKDWRVDPDAIEEALALWRAPGATELGVMRQQLEAAGIALDPPPDWRGWSAIEVAPAAGGD